jgi:ABC transporter substrate binding protein (PQQ-dependent alcohol dehydrogenase system)
LLRLAAALLLAFVSAARAQPLEIKAAYLHVAAHKTAISLLDVPADDDGLAGAQLATQDNNTTGKFLNQQFALEDVRLGESDDPKAAVAALAARGVRLVIADLAPTMLLAAADGGRDLLLFNAGAPDERLREEDCRANVVHTAPSRAMLADALAQYLVWKKWRRWFLVVGSHDNDRLFGDALKRAATRFGAKIVETRTFEDTGGARRTDSGIAQIQRQIPLFTQSVPEHDVLVAADESEVFAGYLPYRTTDPRPVAGSAGLMPKSWDASQDQWGATQLQSRFVALFHRRMSALDFQAWVAARMIGEAATHVKAADPKAMLGYFTSADFALAAFKGQRLSVRDWNLQLRQPILLTDGRNVVSTSPQDGFLHQVTALDTLGPDRPETKCRLP